MGTLADDLMLKVMLILLLMLMQMSMLMLMLMLLHTSERTIVPQTVIFFNFPAGCYIETVHSCSRAVYESIRKIPTARSTEISVPSQTSIQFFPWMAQNGPFRPFFGLYGVKMGRSLFDAHPEGAMRRVIRAHQVDSFSI